MNKKNDAVTLIELLISVAIISVVIISFYSIDTFSRNQVLNSDRRAKVQNELSYILDHMSKYVQQGRGDLSRPAIAAIGSGFKVYVDFNNTPSDLVDDALISYSLSGAALSVNCSGANCPFSTETLSNRITTFTSQVIGNGSSVEVNLVARYNSSEAVSLRNPQVEMKTKIICNNCSTN